MQKLTNSVFARLNISNSDQGQSVMQHKWGLAGIHEHRDQALEAVQVPLCRLAGNQSTRTPLQFIVGDFNLSQRQMVILRTEKNRAWSP